MSEIITENDALTEMFLSETPERISNLKFRKDEDSGMMYVLSLNNNDFIILNNLSVVIFEMSGGKTSIKEIVDRLRTKNAGVTFEEMLSNTIFCIRDMQSKGVLYKGNPSILKELEIAQC